MEPYYRMQWNVGGGAAPQLVQVPTPPPPPPPQQIMAVPRLAQANSNSSLVSLKVNVAPPVILQNNVRFAGAPGGSVVLPGQPTAGSQGSPPTPRNPMYIPLAPAAGGVLGKPGVTWRNDPQFQPGGRVPLMIRQQTPPPAPTTALIQAQQFATEPGPTYVPVEAVPSNNQDNFAQISPQFGGGVGGETRYYVVGQGHQGLMIAPPNPQLPVMEQQIMKPAQEQPPSLKGLQLGPPQLVQLDGQLGIFQPVLPFHFPEVNNSGGGDGPGQVASGIMGNNEEGEGQQQQQQQQQYLIMTRGQEFNEVGNHHGEANYNQ